jgi:hypothetical protein
MNGPPYTDDGAVPYCAAGTYDLRVCCNGVLSGLVMVTSMCGFIDPWAAVVCGFIAGAAYPFMSFTLVSNPCEWFTAPTNTCVLVFLQTAASRCAAQHERLSRFLLPLALFSVVHT